MIIPLEILKIKDELRYGYHALCRVHINGKEFRMLVDTGSSMTIFNIKKSKEISKNDVEDNNQKISTVGNRDMQSKYVIIDEMKIGDKIIKDYKTILLDLEHLNQYFRSNGQPLIDGILGGDILFEYKAIINYQNREMILN
jgi:hypothetical protein